MRALALGLAAILLGGHAQATSYVLDFTAGSQAIPQTFGDNAEVDLGYRAVQSLAQNAGWGSALTATGNLNFWTTGYGDLGGAAWGGPNPSRGEIRIESTDPTDTVMLDSFDMGGWTADEPASWYIFDLAWNTLDSGTGTAPNVGGRLSVAPGVGALGGLIFQWGDNAWAVGLQNFAFTVGARTTPPTVVSFSQPNPDPVDPGPSVIPLPAAAPLLLSGMALLGWVRTRRRA